MKSYLSAAALAVAALCTSAPASAAIVLSFTPSATQISIGQTVMVDVGISGLGAEFLSGLDVNFVYSTAVLNWVSTAFSAAQFGMIFPDPIGETGGPGDMGYDVISLEDDATLAGIQTDDAFKLFTLEFTGAADGATTLTLGGGANDRLFLGSGGINAVELAVDVGSVCIAVGSGSCAGASQPIPEPATYGLAAIALLAAGVAGRSRRRASAATV